MNIQISAITAGALAAALAATLCHADDVQATKVAKASTEPGVGHSVTLHGNACNQLKANPNTKVQVVYGCSQPPPS